MMPPNSNTTTQDNDQNKNQQQQQQPKQKQQEQVSSSETKKRPSSSTSDEQKVAIKCPRCDSPNTKFCYYNNYSLTQPRHFCKTCRRYWTNGGSLRNVPVGGGCRKKQKFKHSSSSSSSQSIISKYSSSPSLDFHLGGLLPLPLPLPFSSKLHHHANHQPFLNNQFSSSFQLDHSLSSNSLMGLNNLYPFSSSNGNGFNGANGMNNFMNVNSTTSGVTTNSTSLASSIESLSCMNQDLHLKLQQQRLATMFCDDNKKDGNHGISSSNVLVSDQVSSIEKPQTILFQNLDISKTNVPSGGDAPMEWLFGNSYSSFMMTPTITSTIGGVCINGDHDHANNNSWINSGVNANAWSDLQQQQQPYTALP